VARILPALIFAWLLSTVGATADMYSDCASPEPSVAIPACTAVIDKLKSTGAVGGDWYGPAFISRGIAYRKIGELDLAIIDLTQVIEFNQLSVGVFNERGSAHYAKRSHGLAIADFTKAIELDPKSAIIFLSRGHSHRADGENDRAIADYNKAIELDPKFGLAYLSRGDAHWAMGKRELAIADHAKAVEFNPKLATAGVLGVHVSAMARSASADGAPRGIRIITLTEGAPAAKRGLLAGDIILSANDQPTPLPNAFTDYIQSQPPGTVVRLHVWRDGKQLNIEVPLAARLKTSTTQD
jgi:tetratricopeptide (TPR) repeat protein